MVIERRSDAPAAQIAKYHFVRTVIFIVAALAEVPPDYQKVAVAGIRPVMTELRSDLDAMPPFDPMLGEQTRRNSLKHGLG
jgi:hypothetical protein